MTEEEGTVATPNNLSRRQIEYRYHVSQKALDNPEEIDSIRILLPSGLSAPFVRVDAWKPINS
jgi:hypothetical protein